ncbi:GNAT family N-acetyltransferase [Muricoccus aerilatus]|uniref:GNAT family N-acetyltransferase n=1 Tax=Muricoccus aerilatus TaxID=452982 RepID=UPI000693DE69|nr:GNAT family N-acetyltransferase [Roseomonas aerilata]
MQIEVTAAATEADRDVILSGLLDFIRAEAGVVGMPLAVLVRDEAGLVVGGLTGRTSGAWLFVELFWLPETLRGSGLGTRVLLAAETEAQTRGCLGSHLDTYSFQAPGFYRKLGYEVFGIIEDHPPGHQRFWMRKRFVSPEAGAAASKTMAR